MQARVGLPLHAGHGVFAGVFRCETSGIMFLQTLDSTLVPNQAIFPQGAPLSAKHPDETIFLL